MKTLSYDVFCVVVKFGDGSNHIHAVYSSSEMANEAARWCIENCSSSTKVEVQKKVLFYEPSALSMAKNRVF